MTPDKVGKDPAAHAEEKTGGACLELPQESCRKALRLLPRQIDSFQLPLFFQTTPERKYVYPYFFHKIFHFREKKKCYCTRSRNRPWTPATQIISGCISKLFRLCVPNMFCSFLQNWSVFLLGVQRRVAWAY